MITVMMMMMMMMTTTVQQLDLFVWCVRLSRFLVSFRMHLKSISFHFIST